MHDELVAYLDGEVSDARRAAIEQRLSRDPAYRQQLVELQATWQWLDRLPVLQPDASFTQTTMTLAITDVRGEGRSHRRRWPGARRLKWGLAAALAAAMGFAAVYVPSYWRHQAEMVELPLVHNLDLYRYVDQLEFLRQLHEERLFEVPADEAP